MKDTVKGIPEAFYEVLTAFAPGVIAVEGLVLSPWFQRVLVDSSYHVPQLGAAEQLILVLFVSYALGQILTQVSNVLIRKPVWLLFGQPVNNLLNVGPTPWLPYPLPFRDQAKVSRIREALNLDSMIGSDSHYLMDTCERFVRAKSSELGQLCQKRHGLVVFCRNIAFVAALLVPAYIAIWKLALALLLISVMMLFRWNYLRIRRAKFVLGCVDDLGSQREVDE